jgi:hypothetical protein
MTAADKEAFKAAMNRRFPAPRLLHPGDVAAS